MPFPVRFTQQICIYFRTQFSRNKCPFFLLKSEKLSKERFSATLALDGACLDGSAVSQWRSRGQLWFIPEKNCQNHFYQLVFIPEKTVKTVFTSSNSYRRKTSKTAFTNSNSFPRKTAKGWGWLVCPWSVGARTIFCYKLEAHWQYIGHTLATYW